ncbi:hypothetical protein JKF63_01115 [Porcisia hertigi]|uniref:Uncharacterized protein n=1 Tax=Porcisia hertigi TaxID=2761500 RepID=A0A836H2L9_9TRYP|nr:hypothetical protein JKF63_01115 [Porcisia hertigi]
MPGSPTRDLAAGGSQEEEEEEELGPPISHSPTPSAEACNRRWSAIGSNKSLLSEIPGDGRTRSWRTEDTNDDYALDIPFVKVKGTSLHTRLGASGLTGLTTASDVKMGCHQRRKSDTTAAAEFPASEREQEDRQLSIAGKWVKAESASLNQYQGSDVLDDSDRQQDEAEFYAWKERAAFRRQQLVLL